MFWEAEWKKELRVKGYAINTWTMCSEQVVKKETNNFIQFIVIWVKKVYFSKFHWQQLRKINSNNTIPFQLVSYEQEQFMDGLTVDSHALSRK